MNMIVFLLLFTPYIFAISFSKILMRSMMFLKKNIGDVVPTTNMSHVFLCSFDANIFQNNLSIKKK